MPASQDEGADGPSSESERVYQMLKSQILLGQLRPGTKLRQEAIARACETSRTPAREAMLRLAAAGLVIATPGRGVVIQDYTRENYLALSQVRALTEGYAVRRACLFMPIEVIDELRDQVRSVLDAKAKTRDELRAVDDDVVEADLAVHRAIAEWSKNPILANTIERLGEMNQMARSQDVSIHHTAILEDVLPLLQAIADRDADRAHHLMYSHIIDFSVGAKDILLIKDP
jgi:DNA-binding GntR family transcriptional regulator